MQQRCFLPQTTSVKVSLTARYAIYFSPEDNSELELFGATVLRRRAADASEWENPEIPVEFPSSSCWKKRVIRPANYGFHATIKAPFALAGNHTAEQLHHDLEAFCRKRQPIPLEGLIPTRTTRYDALALSSQPEALKALAADSVQEFEKYRAPLTEQDIKRRDPSSLSARENRYLTQYGYPYILDDFNFHMTLSGANDHNDAAYLVWLKSLYQAMVSETPVLDRLCIFYQPNRDTAFVRITEFKLGNTSGA